MKVKQDRQVKASLGYIRLFKIKKKKTIFMDQIFYNLVTLNYPQIL